MMIELHADKNAVIEEVAQTTGYTGAKMEKEPEESWKRISTVDEDKNQLERFWNEARADLCQEMMGIAGIERMENGVYVLPLKVSSMFDASLLPSMELSLFSFFVMSITGKWFIYTNKTEAGAYTDKSTALLDDIKQKALHKKAPVEPEEDF